jgi:hypothetical protein
VQAELYHKHIDARKGCLGFDTTFNLAMKLLEKVLRNIRKPVHGIRDTAREYSLPRDCKRLLEGLDEFCIIVISSDVILGIHELGQ